MKWLIIGTGDDNRIQFFQEALRDCGEPPAHIVDYVDMIEGKVFLPDHITDETIIRIESPGKSFEATKRLLKLGATLDDPNGKFERISLKQLETLEFDKGQFLYPRQWFLGLNVFLETIKLQLAGCSGYHLMNHPDDILMMFDKPRCHQHLLDHNIRVPRALQHIRSYDELLTAMWQADINRVFIKSAHGSSASGIIAYHTNGSKHRAITSIEIVRKNGVDKLYNTRSIRTLYDHAEIAKLIDMLCKHRVQVEEWIPKGVMEGKPFDLRVVVIDGQACHTVARLSHSPMTNLHLLNERRPADEVICTIGQDNFENAMQLCESAMQTFPRSFYAGIDLLIASGYQSHYILEINAFGDLLKNITHQGLSPYHMEIERIKHVDYH